MAQLDRRAVAQRVGRVGRGDREVHRRTTPAQREAEPADSGRQLRSEAELPAVVAHPAEAGDQRDPRAGQRRDVQPVPRVVLEIVQVHQRGLGEVVVREFQVAGLGGEDGLGARRQRRVAHRQRLVVGEGARLVLGGERVAAPVHREDQVGLLDHLLAVDVEVRRVQQERVPVGLRARLEVPDVVFREAAILLVDALVLVVRQRHRLGGRAPGGELLGGDVQPRGVSRPAFRHGGGAGEVPLCHQVRVRVVVDERAVLVRTGHPVQMERAVVAVVTERRPQPGRLDQ